MPVPRTVASVEQKAFFARLSAVPLVLGAKAPSDQWSVNLHGNILLYDKDWSTKTNKDPHETLLAIRDTNDAVPLTSSGEPRVHLHVDWRDVRWARLEVQPLDLIGTDRAVVFYLNKESTRLFALYCLDKDIGTVMALGKWIDLKPTGAA